MIKPTMITVLVLMCYKAHPMPGSYSSHQPSEGATGTTPILQKSKLRWGGGTLRNVEGLAFR